LARYVSSREKKCDRYDDSEDCEEESTIFLARKRGICDIEFDRKSSEYDETNESKSARESWYSIGKVHSIEYYHIPEYSYHDGYPVDREIQCSDLYARKPIIERYDSSEYMTHIRYLDTREPDDESYSNLHDEPCERWHLYPASSDGIQIIYE
jgi:hypothetical protein